MAGIEDADSQAPKSLPLTLFNDAIFALTLPLEALAGEVLTEHGPFRVAIARLVVRSDELPSGRTAKVRRAAARIHALHARSE